MDIHVQLTRAPISPNRDLFRLATGDSGALAEFTGIVRGTENGRPIAALEYEAYEQMALPLMRKILEQLDAAHRCHHALVIHRLGTVPVGEAAIYVGITAPHRAEAFQVLTAFLDRLKQDVPIWKCGAVPAAQPVSAGV